MNTNRIALYAGTRNIYHDMVVSAKSLLYHNGADNVIFLIEDDEFPEQLPDLFTCINVSNQTYFPSTGPNFKCRWTYMVMMRVALTKLFPTIDRMLTLDHDTIIRKPIDYIWNVNLAGYYYAAVEEKQIRNRKHPYYNFGVTLHNLAQLRKDGADDTIIRSVNSAYFQYCEQDAVNSVCAGHILEIPPEYNAMWFNRPTVPEQDIIIKHYAATSTSLSERDDYKYYDSLTWDTVLNHQKGVDLN